MIIQAANETNTEYDVWELAKEIQALTEEVDRIGNATEFNTIKLFTGEFSDIKERELYDDRFVFTSTTRPDVPISADSPVQITNMQIDIQYMEEKLKKTAYFDRLAKLKFERYSDNNGMDTVRLYFLDKDGKSIIPQGGSYHYTFNWLLEGSAQGIEFGKGPRTFKKDGITFTMESSAQYGSVILDLPVTRKIKHQVTIDNSLKLQVGANGGQHIGVSLDNMSAKELGITALDLSSRESIYGGTVIGEGQVDRIPKKKSAFEIIDDALTKLSSQRSLLGAAQNRLEHTVQSLDNAAENLTASESRIRDVNMAKKTMDFVKGKLLMQSTQAMFAQGKQSAESVLQLLNA